MPRLFVAIRPPEDVRDALIDTMEALDIARWQSDEQLHLTLRYVGEVDGRTANDLYDELGRIDAQAFDLHIRGVGHFERKGGVNALWAGVAPCPGLEALRIKVERACLLVGLPREERKFLPHVTLARMSAAQSAIGGWLSTHGTLNAGHFAATEFTLYESILGAAGSHYEPVESWPLSTR